MDDLGEIADLQRDWETFARAVREIRHGDLKTFRKVNQTLGYNLAKSVPILLKHKTDLDRVIRGLRERIADDEKLFAKEQLARIKAEQEAVMYKDITKSLQEDLLKTREAKK